MTLLNRKKGATGNTKYAYVKGPYYIYSTRIYLLCDCTIEPILLKRGAGFFIDLSGFQEVDETMHGILANFPDDSFV